jgi:hypothetical protein
MLDARRPSRTIGRIAEILGLLLLLVIGIGYVPVAAQLAGSFGYIALAVAGTTVVFGIVWLVMRLQTRRTRRVP